MQYTILPVLDSGPYPGPVASDHEIWRSLPKDLQDATIETLVRVEKQIVTAPKADSDEQKFHDELRAAMIVAIGVLKEAAEPYKPNALITKREGNA